jgi:RNA polymerase sigma factor (sigma-70 family)
MSDTFEDLMGRLRAGDAGAAREIVDRYARRLLALVRSRIDRRLAHKVDPEDVVQSAYKSFFVRQRQGGLVADDWDNLWGVLAMITLRKCFDRVQYLRAQCRNPARERRSIEGEVELWELAEGREPGPDRAVLLAEAIDELLGSVDQDERPILELSLEGYSVAEISERLGRAQRSVRRLRERARKRLERMQTVAC